MTGFPNALPADRRRSSPGARTRSSRWRSRARRVRRVANILYEVPLPSRSAARRRSATTCSAASVLEVDANFFSKDPWSISLGPGTARIAYRPIPFDGTFTPSRLIVR